MPRTFTALRVLERLWSPMSHRGAIVISDLLVREPRNLLSAFESVSLPRSVQSGT